MYTYWKSWHQLLLWLKHLSMLFTYPEEEWLNSIGWPKCRCSTSIPRGGNTGPILLLPWVQEISKCYPTIRKCLSNVLREILVELLIDLVWRRTHNVYPRATLDANGMAVNFAVWIVFITVSIYKIATGNTLQSCLSIADSLPHSRTHNTANQRAVGGTDNQSDFIKLVSSTCTILELFYLLRSQTAADENLEDYSFLLPLFYFTLGNNKQMV